MLPYPSSTSLTLGISRRVGESRRELARSHRANAWVLSHRESFQRIAALCVFWTSRPHFHSAADLLPLFNASIAFQLSGAGIQGLRHAKPSEQVQPQPLDVPAFLKTAVSPSM